MNYYDYSLIPERITVSLYFYLEYGTPLGGFLTAVMSNDLFEAVAKADDKNISLIPVLVNYIRNKFPDECHGSKEKVKSWYKEKRSE